MGRRIPRARWLAWLAIVALPLAACDLLLDVDKLGSGDGNEAGLPDGSGDDASGDDGSMPGDAGGDVVFDAFLFGDSRPPPDGSIPKCVPPPPDGGDPLAVTWTSIATPPSCPPGYTAPAAITLFADFASQPATCALGTCACAGPSGTGSCSTEMEYYDDAACMVARGAVDVLPSGACVKLNAQGASYAKSVSRFNGGSVTCPSSGTPQTTKPPPVWGTEIAGCKRDPAAMLPSCGDGGLVPMTPTNQAFACYTTTAATCVAPYVTRFTFDTTTGYTDTRACKCDCQKNVSTAACTGGSIDSYPQQNCVGSPTTFGDDSCRLQSAYGPTARVHTAGTPPAGVVSCTPVTDETGQAQPAAGTVTLCCLDRCDGCKINVVLPGNSCAAAYDACSADPDCRAYRSCVVSMCGGTDCATCQSLLDASAATITLYDAIGTCVTTQCASSCP